MPGKRKETVDIREMLRRFQQGQSDRAIARELQIDRKTVGRYRVWAGEQSLLSGPLPTLGELHQLAAETLNTPAPPQNVSTVAVYGGLVAKLRKQGVEVAAIHERLKDRGFTGSYSAVHRYVQHLEEQKPDVTVRVETLPGEEAQADFGYAGKMIEPQTGILRKAWAFVMTLSWSRHQFVEFVFDQTVGTWLRLHRNAFEYFGGVPERVVIDNLKTAIVRACWDDPAAQQSYRECAEHYGFMIAPCRPGTPEHKGKVEQGGVHYVKRNFLGGREPTSLTQTNRDVRRWVQTTAGQRIHGTTKEQPLQRFETERAALLPLPSTPYDLAVWKQATLHRDCHVVFEQAYYSAPFRLVGQRLWVRGGSQVVQIYTANYQVVATHTRAERPGQRVTHLDHLPHHKVPGLIITREECRREAAEMGPGVQQLIDVLLEHRPEDRLRSAGRVLRLAERFGPQRLEAACARSLYFDDPSYVTVKRILEEELDIEQLSSVLIPAPAFTFARTATELVGHLTGGPSWR